MLQRERVGIYIKKIDIAFDSKCNKLLKLYDITHTQFKILLYLLKTEKGEETRQIDLENHFGLSNPTVTGILHRLEDKGFIIREKSAKDSRSNVIILREKTLLLENKLMSIADLMEATLTNGLTESELNTAYYLLNKILDNIIQE